VAHVNDVTAFVDGAEAHHTGREIGIKEAGPVVVETLEDRSVAEIGSAGFTTPTQIQKKSAGYSAIQAAHTIRRRPRPPDPHRNGRTTQQGIVQRRIDLTMAGIRGQRAI
jgi:hypothetical protein